MNKPWSLSAESDSIDPERFTDPTFTQLGLNSHTSMLCLTSKPVGKRGHRSLKAEREKQRSGSEDG